MLYFILIYLITFNRDSILSPQKYNKNFKRKKRRKKGRTGEEWKGRFKFGNQALPLNKFFYIFGTFLLF